MELLHSRAVTPRSRAALAVPLLALGLVVSAAPGSSAAAPKRYKNCADLNKVYPSGVGVPGAKDKVAGGGRGVTNYTRNTAVYKLNRGLDRDKDYIACERHATAPSKPAPKPAPTPAPTPAQPTDAGFVQFADPSGSHLCALSGDTRRQGTWGATCVQLQLMGQARYKALCKQQRWEGLTTRGEGSGWSCRNNPSATPWPGQPGLQWAGRSTPVITGTYGFAKGRKLVVLPAGKSLTLGTVTCSQTSGSTSCSNSATKQGFTVTPTGTITWRGVDRVGVFGDEPA